MQEQEVFLAPFGIQERDLGFHVIQRPGWYQVISPKHPTPSANEIIHSVLSANQVQKAIDQAIATYNDIGTPFKWCVTPKTEPKNMAELLIARGFRGWAARGMYVSVEKLDIPVPEDATIERLTEKNLEDYVEASLRGWANREPFEEERRALREVHSWNLKKKKDSVFNYLARIRGEPVGTAGMILKEKSAYLVGGNVFKAYRGRGLYKGLLGKRFSDLKDLQRPLAVTHARETTSAPILEKLGFETAYRYQVFQYGGIMPE